MIPRFDRNELEKIERNKKAFALAVKDATFYFSGTELAFVVKATPSHLFVDMVLAGGYPVSIFLIPFPPFIGRPRTPEDHEQVKNYQAAALELMGISTDGLFIDGQLDYTAYYRAIREYDGSKIYLDQPLRTFAKKLLPSSETGSDALIPLGKGTMLSLGVRPAIVWNAWENPELYALVPGINAPLFDKTDLKITFMGGVPVTGQGRLTRQDFKRMLSVLLEEL